MTRDEREVYMRLHGWFPAKHETQNYFGWAHRYHVGRYFTWGDTLFYAEAKFAVPADDEIVACHLNRFQLAHIYSDIFDLDDLE